MVELSRRGFLAASAALSSGSFVSQASATSALTADVVIAGSGVAGLAAAVEALDAGASVILVECADHIGGAAPINGGFLRQFPDPRATVAKMLNPANVAMRRTRPDVAESFAKKAVDMAEWLKAHGVELFGNAQSRYLQTITATKPVGFQRAVKGVEGKYRSGLAIVEALGAYIKSKGGKILTGTHMDSVIKKNGRAIGITCTQKGRKLSINAKKGVVLAAGGWKGDVELRTLIDPRLTKEVGEAGVPYYHVDGSGIRAGLAAGGVLIGDLGNDYTAYRTMFGSSTYGFDNPDTKLGLPGINVAGKSWAECVFVNAKGERFCNETNTPRGKAKEVGFFDLAFVQPGLVMWCIFDDKVRAAHKWNVGEPNCEKGLYASAGTPAELAAKIGVPADVLAKTLSAYNDTVDKKSDSAFGKAAENLIAPVSAAPLHAVRIKILIAQTCGGVAVNGDGAVIDTFGRPIPGLFAAGENAGGLSDPAMPGCITRGRIAGCSAAK